MIQRILLSTILCLGVAQVLDAQEPPTGTLPRLELRFGLALQKSKYLPAYGPAQLLLVKRRSAYRPAISCGLRYYAAPHWFAEYQLAYARQGGGFDLQPTRTAYLKNSLLLGWTTRHTHRLVLEAYSGLALNSLLSAKWRPAGGGSGEKVGDLFRKHHFSLPFGLGLKTRLGDQTHLSLQSFAEFGLQNISSHAAGRALPFVFPAFQFTASKIIR